MTTGNVAAEQTEWNTTTSGPYRNDVALLRIASLLLGITIATWQPNKQNRFTSWSYFYDVAMMTFATNNSNYSRVAVQDIYIQVQMII